MSLASTSPSTCVYRSAFITSAACAPNFRVNASSCCKRSRHHLEHATTSRRSTSRVARPRPGVPSRGTTCEQHHNALFVLLAQKVAREGGATEAALSVTSSNGIDSAHQRRHGLEQEERRRPPVSLPPRTPKLGRQHREQMGSTHATAPPATEEKGIYATPSQVVVMLGQMNSDGPGEQRHAAAVRDVVDGKRIHAASPGDGEPAPRVFPEVGGGGGEEEMRLAARREARARRQRERRRLERATRAAKKALVKKVAALGNNGQWREAISEFDSAISNGLSPDVYVYGSCVGAAAHSGRWREALELLRRMREDGIVPTTPVYNAAIKACSRAGQLKLTLALLDEMRSHGGAHAIGSSNNGDGSGARRGVVNEKRGGGGGGSFGKALTPSSATIVSEPDIQTFNTVMSACGRVGKWELALEVMKKAQECGLHPTSVTYNTAIFACGKGGEADRAVELLAEMRGAGLIPNAISFNSAIAACSEKGGWERALSLLREMETSGVVADAFSYSSAITACGRGGQWLLAVGLLDTMRRKGIVPGVIAVNAVITACGEAGQWERAVGLLREMEAGAAEEINAGPDTVSFNAAINACSTAGEWQRAVSLLREMQRNLPEDDAARTHDDRVAGADGRVGGNGIAISKGGPRQRGPLPDVVSYSTAIMACSRAGNWDRAIGLLEQMQGDGLVPNSVTFTAAIAACRDGGGQAGVLLTLLDVMRSCGVSLDAICYGTALDACAKASLCEQARSLLADMVAAGVEVDKSARSAVTAACSHSTTSDVHRE